LTEEYIFKEECYKIIGCAMEVHKQLGNGFLEAVYEEALRYEFKKNNIPFEEQKLLEIYYKDIVFEKKYIADFLCYDKIIVELKVAENISDEHYSQVLNYLNVTKLNMGLILNFGNKSLQYKRIII
jgi:GxxExxY protein